MFMKHPIRLIVLVAVDNDVLLIKDSKSEKYELPSCQLSKSQQPQESIRQYLAEQLGIRASGVSLFDAVNNVKSSSGNRLDILFTVQIDTDEEITKSPNVIWQPKVDKTDVIEGDSFRHLCNFWGLENRKSDFEEKFLVSSEITHVVYSDGGSRGNPGHSAAAYVLYNHEGERLKEGGEYLGITTSTVAEYTAVKLAMEAALEVGAESLECRIDNMAVVNQMNAVYVVSNRDLWPIHENIISLVKRFKRVSFVHINRELNTEADRLVNRILDRYLINS